MLMSLTLRLLFRFVLRNSHQQRGNVGLFTICLKKFRCQIVDGTRPERTAPEPLHLSGVFTDISLKEFNCVRGSKFKSAASRWRSGGCHMFNFPGAALTLICKCILLNLISSLRRHRPQLSRVSELLFHHKIGCLWLAGAPEPRWDWPGGGGGYGTCRGGVGGGRGLVTNMAQTRRVGAAGCNLISAAPYFHPDVGGELDI